MTITLGSNIASLRGIRALKDSTDGLSAVFERLSSGQRINRASDDSAALALADNLSADHRIYTQGVRNLNDGLSLLNVADSALESLTEIIVRLEELASQAANGAYGDRQRAALDAEAQSLSEEFLRIVRTTRFNDRSVFDGSVQEIHLQAGYGENAILTTEMGGVKGTGELARVDVLGGTVATNVTTGDFNGDGIVDVATSHATTQNIEIRFGYGNGEFSSATTISGGGQLTDIQSGDFNNDGILDLIVSNSTKPSVQIFTGAGDGTFSPASSTTIGGAGISVVIGDMNGDGNLDAITGYGTSYEILLGDGQGNLNSLQVDTYLGGNGELAVGDFNNDGILDLTQTLTGQASRAVVYIGNGDGTVTQQVTIGGLDDLANIQTGDVNGDGNVDIVASGGKNMHVAFGDGEGGFSQFNATYTGNGTAEDIQLGDMNGDGFTDVVMSLDVTNELVTMLNDGEGNFTIANSETFGRATIGIALADINNDSALDAVTVVNASATFSLYIGQSENGVGAILPFSLATMAGARQALPMLAGKREILTQQRGEVGASQSRVGVAMNVLESAAESFKAAESAIRDADVASEAAKLARLSILQQASTAVLTQANIQPALALELLS